MMGTKIRSFAPLCNRSIEDLVPADSFYRYLEAKLDLSFVRDLVRTTYKDGGRPSVDPRVFFKLQLVMFFEGLRSERELVRVAADRLSVRWYLGYDLDEELPDHSSLTRIRKRYGLAVFRRFFETIVEQCRQAGLIWGKELYFDATQVNANASLDSIAPRFAVEAHLGELFDDDPSDGSGRVEGEAQPIELPVPISEAEREQLGRANEDRHDWLARDGAPDRTIIRAGYRRRSDFEASTTDPDAALMAVKKGGLRFGYHDHYAVDGGKARIILEVLVTPADVMENQPFLDMLWRACFRWQIRPCQVTGDTTYGTTDNIVGVEDQQIHAYVPLPDFDQRTPFYGASRFTYDPEHDEYRCPQGQVLRRKTAKYTEGVVVYQAETATCNACPLKAACTESNQGRQVRRSLYAEYLDRVRAYHQTPAYEKAMAKRKVWVEPLFGEAKDWHGLRRFRLRRLWKVNIEALLIATGQNLKRLLRKCGWGRRPWPTGAPEAPLAHRNLLKSRPLYPSFT
ncbi:MAG: IS1182 family transposase [Actinomycetota bacterium]|nr:IS1182 family transposase [Actinomycetota bacterium]